MSTLLYVTAEHPPRTGGQARLSGYFVDAVRERHRVIVAVQKGVPSQDVDTFTLHEDRPTALNKLSQSKVRANLFFRALSIAQRTRGHRFDAVIAGDAGGATTVAGYYAAVTGLPFINFCHGRDFCWRVFRGREGEIHQRLLRSSVLTIANSRFSRRELISREIAGRDVVVIPPPVSLQRFRPIPRADNPLTNIFQQVEGRPILLTASRLVERKGVLNVLFALARLKQDFLYIIVGDGPELDAIRLVITLLRLDNKVVCVGAVSDEALVQYYNLADAFVLTPFAVSKGARLDIEGFGMVFLEANACGVPVVASASGGVEDAVADGRSGLLVPPRDIDALADALERILSDGALRQQLADGAREWASTFDEKVVGGHYLDAIDRVVAEAPPRPLRPLGLRRPRWLR